MADYLITAGGTWQLQDTDEAGDLVCVLTEEHAAPVGEPVVALSRQQVVTRLGRGIPTDFPAPDVVIGDPDQGATRGWWEATVQRWLAGEVPPPPPAAERAAEGPDAVEGEQNPDHWAIGSRQWDDVDLSGADQRILIATSAGIVTPSGIVKSRPLGAPTHLSLLVCKSRWAAHPGGPDPQVWVTGEALEALEFPIDGLSPSEVPDTVAAFFGCEVTYSKSGYFTASFSVDDPVVEDRTATVILLPFLALDPSPSRPEDRGLAGIEGTDTELPDDEIAAAHLLADRLYWLTTMDAMPAPRWSQVGAQLAVSAFKRARPKAKNSKGDPPALVPCPLPSEITPTGKMPSPWWPSGKKTPHRSRGDSIDVEVDQQAAYLPSAEGLYLGYGKPGWADPDPAVFNEPRPPFGLFQVTTPAGTDLDGLHRKLPLPHPAMRWDAPVTWWATTIDMQQLIAPTEQGGAGIAPAELMIDAAWVWPEQHQWLKNWAGGLRSALAAARADGRADYEEMIKAIYTSYLGRLEAVGDGAWKYPLLQHQQPAWYAAVEAMTRWRAMRYVTRIARELDVIPVGWHADAWFYRVPGDFDPAALEDPLRPDGTRSNGAYRIKTLSRPDDE
ncbi:hypothetical protein [[Mycobacterium] vasticus]|uniref:Uncharacterized protein n=1 Tax=[Mycobacterium] vasticus TaxID=2875777 RepID=A0ABU5Z3J3_9MYCO|nr:hypothetical protein [Mycolicibacter sp. MYC017]MEB3071972.1 hypothetical protein [Mycolicibacter sp. MYC017]